MTTSSASKKGLLLVLAAALLLSIGGLCVKMIPWQPLSINAFRSIISVGILLVFAKATRRGGAQSAARQVGLCAGRTGKIPRQNWGP